MVGSEPRKPKAPGLGQGSSQADRLPYSIETWDAEQAETVRVLARAASASLARAIFQTACEEHPGAHVVLRQGSRIIADSKERRHA